MCAWPISTEKRMSECLRQRPDFRSQAASGGPRRDGPRAGEPRAESRANGALTPADLDGDGARRAALPGRRPALRRRGNLDDRWSWPTRDPVREVIPARAGQPAVVVLDSMVGLDGATGVPAGMVMARLAVLDPGDATRPPRPPLRIRRCHGLPTRPASRRSMSSLQPAPRRASSASIRTLTTRAGCDHCPWSVAARDAAGLSHSFISSGNFLYQRLSCP